MGDLHPGIPEDLLFYVTAPHECSYLEGREATTLFADPERQLEQTTFTTLSELGFRRSGCLVYTPRCQGCHACIPVRMPVSEFKPDRSQRRNRKANSDLESRIVPASFNAQHIELYKRYIQSRHPDGSMNVEGREEVERFFLCEWSDSLLIEFWLAEQLVAVSVVDVLDSGLSAVYTFFDPDESRRGLGVYAVLCLIEETRQRELPYLYLGYLIHESPKMAYKARYQPLQQLREGRWLSLKNP